jgi:hypothetical protein
MDNPYIINLFLKNINELKPKKYKWKHIKNIFIEICQNIINNFNKKDNLETFIKNYYYYLLLFTYYSNFCYYYNIILDEELIKIDNNIKYDINILKILLLNMNNWQVQNIIKFILPYIVLKNKINKNYIIEISNYIKNYDKIYNTEYDNKINKTLDIILFKYILSKNNNFINYHDFYNKKILNEKLPKNFMNFMNYFEEDTEIFNLHIDNTNINININVLNIIDIVNYIIKDYDSIQFKKISNILYRLTSSNNILEIIIDNNKPVGIIYLKKKLNMIYYNIKEIEELKYLQNTYNHIIIYIDKYDIDNLSSLLTYIHLLTISLKTIDNEPIDVYELNNYIEYNNYYYESFLNFLKFIKNDINKNTLYNKFLIEIFKFYYLYAIYDYYIYYKNDLMESIASNDIKKEKIFNDVCLEIKKMCNLPDNILHYPPFINNKIDDINYIINYSYEQPNYFKLIDFINAIITVFDVKKYNNDFEHIFCSCINTIKEKNKKNINKNAYNIKNEKPIINKINLDTYNEISIVEI